MVIQVINDIIVALDMIDNELEEYTIQKGTVISFVPYSRTNHFNIVDNLSETDKKW